MKRIIHTILILLFLTGINSRYLLARDTESEEGVFSSDLLLELEIAVDLDSLLADVGEDPSYHSARMTYRDPGANARIELDIEVRTRGSFRKDPGNCEFPPLKIRLDNDVAEGLIFQDVKEFKLVTHCNNDLHEFEQYELQEYLIYKAYNIFTGYSFRVRLARITYQDIGDPGYSLTRFAFLLEDADDMAERNGGKLLDLNTVAPDKLDQHYLALMSVFNYMILNTDYSVAIVHNIELISIRHFDPPIPVPYDFDWSGIINIPYDSPYAETKTRYADRHYKGPCLKRKELEVIFEEMRGKREDLIRLFDEFPYLDSDLKSRSLQELNMFFIIIGNRGLVREEFMNNCNE